jgi:5-methylcytosine-specific restriction endonuclease McrA
MSEKSRSKLPTLRPLVPIADTRTAKPSPSPSKNPLYFSAEWKRFREAIIRERGRRCEKCGRAGYVFVDHIIELKDGGAPLDPKNCQVLCGSCHTTKSVERRAERMQAQYRKPRRNDDGPTFA